jgi:hypothetical protein
MFASLVFTLSWWLAASNIPFTHAPLAYFGMGAIGIVLLAWAFGLFKPTESLSRTVAVSGLAVAVLVVAFLVIGMIAGASVSTAQAPFIADRTAP